MSVLRTGVRLPATPPLVPVSQTLIGLGFFYFSVGFEIEICAKTCDKQIKIPDFRFGTLKKQRRE